MSRSAASNHTVPGVFLIHVNCRFANCRVAKIIRSRISNNQVLCLDTGRPADNQPTATPATVDPFLWPPGRRPPREIRTSTSHLPVVQFDDATRPIRKGEPQSDDAGTARKTRLFLGAPKESSPRLIMYFKCALNSLTVIVVNSLRCFGIKTL